MKWWCSQSRDDIIPRRDPVYFGTGRQEDAGEASKERDREWDECMWFPFSLHLDRICTCPCEGDVAVEDV